MLRASILGMLQLGPSTEMTSYRQFFTQLWAYDFSQLVRLHTPLEDLEKPIQTKYIALFLEPDTKMDYIDQTTGRMNREATCGKILDLFCQKFGTGSLFFLRDQLDEYLYVFTICDQEYTS